MRARVRRIRRNYDATDKQTGVRALRTRSRPRSPCALGGGIAVGQPLLWNSASLFLREVTSETSLFAALLTCYIAIPPFMLPFNQKLRVSSYIKCDKLPPRRQPTNCMYLNCPSLFHFLSSFSPAYLFFISFVSCLLIRNDQFERLRFAHLKFSFKILFISFCLS